MGSEYSVPADVEFGKGLVAVALRSGDRVRILHAPSHVLDMIERVAREVSPRNAPIPLRDKLGAKGLSLGGQPFTLHTGPTNSMVGKIFVLRLLEEMHLLGYKFVVSTDLSRRIDTGTLVFEPSLLPEDRHRITLACITPSEFDKLVLTRCNEHILTVVKQAIAETWLPGIQQESRRKPMINEPEEFVIKLKGLPWNSSGQESTMSRQLILRMLSLLSSSARWNVHGIVNVRGGTDVIYLVQDADFNFGSREMGLMSFHRGDRIRLLGFNPSVISATKGVIMRYFQPTEPKESNYFGAHEFDLKGSPFNSTGVEAVRARLLICHLLEAFDQCGWQVHAALDITRKITDKSCFVFRRIESPSGSRFACVALTKTDRLSLLNFPPNVAQVLRNSAVLNYLPGVYDEKHLAGNESIDIKLMGSPWMHFSSTNLNARHMIMRLIRDASGFGYHVVASADVSARYHEDRNEKPYPLDVDTIFFAFKETNLAAATGASAPMWTSNFASGDLPPSYMQATSGSNF